MLLEMRVGVAEGKAGGGWGEGRERMQRIMWERQSGTFNLRGCNDETQARSKRTPTCFFPTRKKVSARVRAKPK